MTDTSPILEFQGEYRFLSNFIECQVIYDGDRYPSVENAYQAAKCEYSNDRKQFQTCTAGYAKQLGRTVKMIPCWNKVKLNVMYGLLEQKFRQAKFGQMLLDTNERHISEGNRWDDGFWGINLHTGKGLNHLGNMLMKLRSELESEYGALSTASSLMTKEKTDHDILIENLTNIDIAATYPDKLDLNRESTELLMKYYSE